MLQVWTNATDTAIAESAEDAIRVWCEATGERLEDYAHQVDEWSTYPPTKVLTIQNFNGDNVTIPRTCAELIASEGRCYLCSTEF